MGQKLLHQLPVVFRAHLLGDEHAACLQHPGNFRRGKVPVAVDHQVKASVLKGQRPRRAGLTKVDAQGREGFPAQRHIGRIGLGGGGEGMGMPKGQEKLAPAGVQIQ